MTRCTRSRLLASVSGIAFVLALLAFLSRPASAEERKDLGRRSLEQAAHAQGPAESIAAIRDVFVRVYYKAYKEGSGGKEIQAEGFLRQFYRPTKRLRIEEEERGEVRFIKVYDDGAGRFVSMAPGKKPIESTDLRDLDKMRDHLRPLRLLFLSYFLREGSVIVSARRSQHSGVRRVAWKESQDAKQTFHLEIENWRLENVVIEEPGKPDYVIDLQEHSKFGPDGIVIPRRAILSRKDAGGAPEKILELVLAQDGIVFNPSIEDEVYESPEAETPATVE